MLYWFYHAFYSVDNLLDGIHYNMKGFISYLSLSKSLRISFSQRVLGPEFPPISKVKNFYNKDFLIKIELGSSYSNAKSIISSILKLIQKKSNFSSLRVNIIVDY